MNIYWALYCQVMSTTAMPYVTGPDLSKRSNNPRFFVLCNSCFWCASYLRRMDTLRCPSCKTEIMESMPIRLDETFLFQYDRKRGVSLQFLIAWAVLATIITKSFYHVITYFLHRGINKQRRVLDIFAVLVLDGVLRCATELILASIDISIHNRSYETMKYMSLYYTNNP